MTRFIDRLPNVGEEIVVFEYDDNRVGDKRLAILSENGRVYDNKLCYVLWSEANPNRYPFWETVDEYISTVLDGVISNENKNIILKNIKSNS